MRQIKIFIILAILAIMAAWVQTINFYPFGVKPNFILLFFMALAFASENFWNYLILLSGSMMILRFQPGWSWELMILMSVLVLAWVAARHLPWHELMNFVIVVTAATTLFYLVINPVFIWRDFKLLMIEVGYSVVLGGILFLLLKEHVKEERFRFGRGSF